MERIHSGLEFIFSSYKRASALLFIVAILLALPVTVTFLGEQQDIRQRASVQDQTCVVIRPDGPGDSTQWLTVQGASQHWQAVSDTTPDGDTSFIANAANTWRKDSFTLANSNLPPNTTITKVDVTARAKSNTIPTGVNLDILVNGASRPPVAKTTTSYVDYTNSFTTNPGTGNPWTTTDIDNLQIGVGSSGLQVTTRVTQVFATFCYASIVLTSTPTLTPSPTPTPTTTLSPTPNEEPTPIFEESTPGPSPEEITIAPTGASCSLKASGDANCDGKVNTDDFNIWRDGFLSGSSSQADFNSNGSVNTDDFNIWRDGFLNPSIAH